MIEKVQLFFFRAVLIQHRHASFLIIFHYWWFEAIDDSFLELISCICISLLLHVEFICVSDHEPFNFDRHRLPYPEHVWVCNIIDIVRTCSSQYCDAFKDTNDQFRVKRTPQKGIQIGLLEFFVYILLDRLASARKTHPDVHRLDPDKRVT
jgi:hypothetical protein